jgi:hypothetical protein
VQALRQRRGEAHLCDGIGQPLDLASHAPLARAVGVDLVVGLRELGRVA